MITSSGCVAVQKNEEIWWQWRMRLPCPERKISVSRTQIVPVESLSDTPVDHLGSRRSCWQREPSDMQHRFQLSLLFPNFCDLTVRCNARAGREGRRA